MERAKRVEADNAALRARLARLQHELDTLLALDAKPVEPFAITPTARVASEATLVALASDWHVEEYVDPAAVNGLNAYDLNESKRRATLYWQNLLRLFHILRRDVAIPCIAVGALGDFFTNNIHDDAAESNLLSPIDAALRAEEYLTSGLDFVLRETRQLGTRVLVVCKSGNHARTTEKRRVATEAGNSLERFMYALMARHFRAETRIRFLSEPGYHTYLPVYDRVIRFHHGHEIRYQGGVGGIAIPTNKAVASWNVGRRADLDVFGHFHQQLTDAGPWVANGSLIGWSPFAISIKAQYQRPKQALFLVDKKRGFTARWPIDVTGEGVTP